MGDGDLNVLGMTKPTPHTAYVCLIGGSKQYCYEGSRCEPQSCEGCGYHVCSCKPKQPSPLAEREEYRQRQLNVNGQQITEEELNRKFAGVDLGYVTTPREMFVSNPPTFVSFREAMAHKQANSMAHRLDLLESLDKLGMLEGAKRKEALELLLKGTEPPKTAPQTSEERLRAMTPDERKRMLQSAYNRDYACSRCHSEFHYVETCPKLQRLK